MTAEYDRLDRALRDGDDEPFRDLTKGDAVVRETQNCGYTLLHSAVRHGSVEAARALLAAGADPDATNDHTSSRRMEGFASSQRMLVSPSSTASATGGPFQRSRNRSAKS